MANLPYQRENALKVIKEHRTDVQSAIFTSQNIFTDKQLVKILGLNQMFLQY